MATGNRSLPWFHLSNLPESSGGFPAFSITYDVASGSIVGIPDHLVDAWSDEFPGLNIKTELLRAETWLVCNPLSRAARPGVDLIAFMNKRFAKLQRQAEGEALRPAIAAIAKASGSRPAV